MGTPHYHPCTGDCPNGLTAGALAPEAAREGIRSTLANEAQQCDQMASFMKSMAELGHTPTADETLRGMAERLRTVLQKLEEEWA